MRFGRMNGERHGVHSLNMVELQRLAALPMTWMLGRRWALCKPCQSGGVLTLTSYLRFAVVCRFNGHAHSVGIAMRCLPYRRASIE